MTAKSEFPDVLEEFLLDFKTEHPNGKSVIHVTRPNKMATFDRSDGIGEVKIIRSDNAPEITQGRAKESTSYCTRRI